MLKNKIDNMHSKIKSVPATSLEDFFHKANEFSGKIRVLKCLPKNGPGVLYRGQADSKWLLETTLERCSENYFSFSKYFSFLQKLNLPALGYLKQMNPPLFKNDFDIIDKDILAAFAYVRHIGGPSPLLDWTKDIDVALFFAFNNVPDSVEYVSVFVYLDGCLPGHGIPSISGVPLIRTVSHEEVNGLLAHQNHSLQKSQYSYCIFGGGSSDVVFAPHEKRFEIVEERGAFFGADLCVKFDLPVDLCKEVFEHLKHKGINEYNLFRTDSAYVRAKWVELFGTKKTDVEKELEMKEFLKLNDIIN